MNHFKDIIEEESKKDYYKNLHEFVYKEYDEKTIFPEKKNIFAALKYTDYDDVKVVILGQDPYHGVNEANGLAFAVSNGVRLPPSLQNIYKELNQELGCYIPNNGYLMKWSRQGVLLLNSVLTVQKDIPASHRGKGWEIFTDKIIEEVNKKDTPVVFMLWGSFAKSKRYLITNPKHLILEAPHPSPFSARSGFFGCNHFIMANEFLKNNGIEPIDWQIENI